MTFPHFAIRIFTAVLLVAVALPSSGWCQATSREDSLRVGTEMFKSSRYDEAEQFFRLGIEKSSTADATHANLLTSLARTLSRRGVSEEPSKLLLEALKIREQLHGNESPELLAELINLSRELRLAKELPQAEMIAQRAVEIAQKLPPERPDHAIALTELAETQQVLGKLAEAEANHRRVLLLRVEQVGEDSPNLIKSLQSLADVYLAQGQVAKAKELAERALEIRKTTYGEDDVRTGKGYQELGRILMAEGNLSEAAVSFRQALDIREQHGAKEPLPFATALSDMGYLYQSQGKRDSAEKLLLKAIEIRQSHLGLDHPDVASACWHLAINYRSQQQFDLAEKYFRRALAIHELHHPPGHLSLAYTRRALATILEIAGNASEARALEEQALGAIRQQPRSGDLKAAQAALQNGVELLQQKKYVAAESALLIALLLIEKSVGPDHEVMGATWQALSESVRQQGRLPEAQVYARRAEMRGK